MSILLSCKIKIICNFWSKSSVSENVPGDSNEFSKESLPKVFAINLIDKYRLLLYQIDILLFNLIIRITFRSELVLQLCNNVVHCGQSSAQPHPSRRNCRTCERARGTQAYGLLRTFGLTSRITTHQGFRGLALTRAANPQDHNSPKVLNTYCIRNGF